MFNRTLIAAIVYLLSIVAILVYVLTLRVIEEYQSIQIYCGTCWLSLLFCGYSTLKGFNSKLHRAFIVLTLSSLSVFFVFIFLYYQFGITDYKAKIGVFLLTELITIGCIIISGLKLGLFKNAKDLL